MEIKYLHGWYAHVAERTRMRILPGTIVNHDIDGFADSHISKRVPFIVFYLHLFHRRSVVDQIATSLHHLHP